MTTGFAFAPSLPDGELLSARLKRETRELHRQAEGSGVMVALLQGRIDLAGYCALLRNLHAIYSALEACLDARHHDSRVQQLWQPALRRLPSLEHDLDHLQGSAWHSDLVLAPAATAYAERLRGLPASEAHLLLAHAYVRYLGDLHGGQMLARLVHRCFDLAAGAGTAFYDFGEPGQVDRLRRDFRGALDALALAPAQADAFVGEACGAFRRHRLLFDELGASQP